MLVLSRKQTESICISDDVVVTVLSIRGSKVKIGIEAPMGTPVHRKELCDKMESTDKTRHVARGTQGTS